MRVWRIDLYQRKVPGNSSRKIADSAKGSTRLVARAFGYGPNAHGCEMKIVDPQVAETMSLS
jgi:hypothetical protein